MPGWTGGLNLPSGMGVAALTHADGTLLAGGLARAIASCSSAYWTAAAMAAASIGPAPPVMVRGGSSMVVAQFHQLDQRPGEILGVDEGDA